MLLNTPKPPHRSASTVAVRVSAQKCVAALWSLKIRSSEDSNQAALLFVEAYLCQCRHVDGCDSKAGPF